MGALMENTTIAELAKTHGRKADTLYRAARKKWPGRTWSKFSAVTESEAAFLIGEKKEVDTLRRANPVKPETQKRDKKPAPGPRWFSGRWSGRHWLLAGLVACPTVASVRNMYGVTLSITDSVFDAVALTVVLSVSALGFVVAGLRGAWVVLLAVVLIAFEAFCNLTRIYGGLMNVGQSGYPTRFLGLVTDVFNSGSHGTAVALGGIVAFVLAAVQYAAIFQLNKK